MMNNLSQNLSEALNKIKSNKLNDAEILYAKILESFPENYDANFYLGTILAKKKNLEEASKYLEKASKINPSIPDVHNNIGIINLGLKNFEKAEKFFKKAIKLKTNFVVAICNLGIALVHQNKIQEAKENFLKAIKLNKNYNLPYFNLANLYKNLEDIKNAEKYYLKTIAIAPKYSPAYNNLLEIYDKSNQNENLEQLIKKAEGENIDKKVISLFKGKLNFKLKNYEKVIHFLESIHFDTKEFHEQTRLETIAKSYDHLGNYSQAFKYFEKVNKISLETNPNNADKRIFFKKLEERLNYFNFIDEGRWNKIDDIKNDEEEPVFLIGFPRSGTTLLDTILRSHSDIDVIEEKPIVDKFLEKLELEIKSNFSNLENISNKLFINMRNTYLTLKNENIENNNKKIFIDKMPLNIAWVGEIYRFFPKAKFILALRNPYDCVLSCFMQNFRLNNAMACFLNIEDAAKTYNIVMQLWNCYSKKFDINYHTIKYEDVVKDFEPTVKNLLKFLDLPWSDKLNDFYKTAQKRGIINTPSYNQVSQPIYTKSMNRWINYEEKFSNVKYLLDPWIKKYEF